MKVIKELFAKRVDERQEMELLKVEHIGFWAMYWMLFAALLIQGVIMQKEIEVVAGEFITFMVTSLIVLIGWVRKGVWSYQSRKVPGIKAYLCYSLVTGVIGGLFFGILLGIRWHQNDVKGIVACVLFYIVFLFGFTFVVFLVFGTIARKRERMLEQAESEEDDMEK